MNRIALLLPCLLTGGTEVATLETALALKSLGYVVEVIVYFDEVDAARCWRAPASLATRCIFIRVRRGDGWLGQMRLAARLAWQLMRGRYRLISVRA